MQTLQSTTHIWRLTWGASETFTLILFADTLKKWESGQKHLCKIKINLFNIWNFNGTTALLRDGIVLSSASISFLTDRAGKISFWNHSMCFMRCKIWGNEARSNLPSTKLQRKLWKTPHANNKQSLLNPADFPSLCLALLPFLSCHYISPPVSSSVSLKAMCETSHIIIPT